MLLFDNKKPLTIRIYPTENHCKNYNDSIELPVFYTPPQPDFSYSFGLCISNENDVKNAQEIFRQTHSQQPNNVYFLYVLGDACRQTDTLQAASATGYPLIIEKGSFLSPDDIKRMVAKLTHKNYALVECGSSFGYANRVLDPRSLLNIKDVSPHFGVCITDLMVPEDESYQYRPDWLDQEKFQEAFKLAAQNFEPNFYVYKLSSRGNDVSSRGNDVSSRGSDLSSRGNDVSSRGLTAGSSSVSSRSPFPSWDGVITPSVTLSRKKLTVIAGPCMLESLELGLKVGTFLKNLCEEFGYQYIFKSSFDKANRTSAGGVRGPGITQGVKWLKHIKQELNVPILTDVHNAEQVSQVANVVDVLQIPAFLFRDKNLLLACAQTNKTIQIKKGQWASAQDMLNVVDFLAQNNFYKVMLAERGSCFGYNNLVVDFRNLIDMAANGNAVVFDATHAVQLPGAKNGKSSGLRHMVPALTRAAKAVGIDGLFMEVHPTPEQALSDADTQLSFAMAREILQSIH